MGQWASVFVESGWLFGLPVLPLIVIHNRTLRLTGVMTGWMAFASAHSIDMLINDTLGFATAVIGPAWLDTVGFVRWELFVHSMLVVTLAAWGLLSAYMQAWQRRLPLKLAGLLKSATDAISVAI